jgi:arylsulfatase A-like enzyme
MKVRTWLGGVLIAIAWTAVAEPAARAAEPSGQRRPNVLLILTDDQGFGDIGIHGNPRIKTPNLDRLSRQGIELEHFYVCPVCSPTRSSLLTGRYNYRTGIVDTYLGRSMMRPDEVTLAQMFRAAGYRTGIFGKWHLGDNYPLRPMDRGFDESLVLKGGGISQASDPPTPGGSSYFDPLLQFNGKLIGTKGYCSDVYTDAALRFIGQSRERPFFAYLAYNAPHEPLQVPDRYYRPYKEMNLSLDDFPTTGHLVEGKMDPDKTARVYGMETNIDDNVGRLLAELQTQKLADDTIVIFLCDNGPQQPRYNAGLHGLKGSVYDGGIRVPFLVRWPGHFAAGKKLAPVAAHIDVMPTLLDACGVGQPYGIQIDGISLLPLLTGRTESLPDRTLYFQWHRGDVPELYRACAAREPRWKLVQPRGAAAGPFAGPPRFELYDMPADSGEMNDVADKHPDVVERLRRGYEAWFKDVCSRGFDPPRIFLGTRHENPVILTRQDLRGLPAGGSGSDVGHWNVYVDESGEYEVTLRYAAGGEGTVRFALRKTVASDAVDRGSDHCTLAPVHLDAGDGRLEARVERAGKTSGVRYVEVRRLP